MKGHADCPRRKVPDKSQGQTSTNQQPVARQTDGREHAKTPANQEKPTRDKRPVSTLEPDSSHIEKGPAASASAKVCRCAPLPTGCRPPLFPHSCLGALPGSDCPIKPINTLALSLSRRGILTGTVVRTLISLTSVEKQKTRSLGLGFLMADLDDLVPWNCEGDEEGRLLSHTEVQSLLMENTEH